MNRQVRSAARQAVSGQGLTQDKLAKRAGLSQQAVSRILNNDRTGNPDSWDRILDALDLKLAAIPKNADIEQLFDRKGE